MSSNQTLTWKEMPKGFKIFVWTILGIVFFVTMAFVFGWVIQLLWNATVADMFGLPAISYWQAIGVFILAKFLFGFGIGGSGSSSSKKKKKEAAKVEAVSDQADAASEDVADLAGEESFQKFWQEEGKDAWDAYSRGE